MAIGDICYVFENKRRISLIWLTNNLDNSLALLTKRSRDETITNF